MVAGPHISLSAETLFSISGLPISNSIVTSLLISFLMISFAVYIRLNLKKTDKPTGVQNVVEWLIEMLYNMTQSITENRIKSALFFPFFASFFLFILFNNWIGLLPGVGTIGITQPAIEEHAASNTAGFFSAQASEPQQAKESLIEETSESETAEPTAIESTASHAEPEFIPLFRPGSADLNTTLALALVSVFMTQIFGVWFLHLGYFKKYLNFSNPIMFFVGILETVLEFAKIVSFAFRLFGNIFAGEVLLVVVAYIGGTFLFFAPMPFYGLELFVGFIQALVFAMLSLVFFNMATLGHDEH